VSLLGAPEKIVVGVAIGGIVPIIALLGNIMANEHAEVSYQLQGTSAIDTRFNPSLEVTPNEGVRTFGVSASVELSGDWLHPRNTVMRTLPTDLVYNLTSTDVYELLR